ncbi:alpha/beta-hydrolase, partial [Cutaneotrichosporon oleaginosum]
PSQPTRPALFAPPGYVRSVHACPAAYPRMYEGTLSRSSYPYSSIPETETKEARAARLEKDKVACAEQAREAAKTEGAGWKTNSGEGLWLSVERWRREDPVEGGVTLLMLHANGMLKEFGTHILSSTAAVVVNEVFFLEDSLHGTSVDLNAGRLPPLHSWADGARDVLNFLSHCAPAFDEEVGWALEWRERASPRKVFAVGHSLGGNMAVHAAAAVPGLFEGLFLVEPMVSYPFPNILAHTAITLKRRDTWPSLDAAKTMRTNPMFSKFPDSIFDLWLSHGVVPKNNGELTLTTPPWCEAVVFSDCRSPQRGWDLLPSLNMPVGFVMSKDAQWMGGEKIARELTSRPPRARNERTTAGHLAVQEDPMGVGEALGRFL